MRSLIGFVQCFLQLREDSALLDLRWQRLRAEGFLGTAKVVRGSTEDPDAWLPSDGDLERWSLCGDDDREHEGAEGERVSVW